MVFQAVLLAPVITNSSCLDLGTAMNVGHRVFVVEQKIDNPLIAVPPAELFHLDLPGIEDTLQVRDGPVGRSIQVHPYFWTIKPLAGVFSCCCLYLCALRIVHSLVKLKHHLQLLVIRDRVGGVHAHGAFAGCFANTDI